METNYLGREAPEKADSENGYKFESIYKGRTPPKIKNDLIS